MIRLQMTRLLLYNDDNDLFWLLHITANTLQINLKEALCYEFIYCLTIYHDLETKRSYERKVNLKNLRFFKKSIERFKNYSLTC